MITVKMAGFGVLAIFFKIYEMENIRPGRPGQTDDEILVTEKAGPACGRPPHRGVVNLRHGRQL